MVARRVRALPYMLGRKASRDVRQSSCGQRVSSETLPSNLMRREDIALQGARVFPNLGALVHADLREPGELNLGV